MACQGLTVILCNRVVDQVLGNPCYWGYSPFALCRWFAVPKRASLDKGVWCYGEYELSQIRRRRLLVDEKVCQGCEGWVLPLFGEPWFHGRYLGRMSAEVVWPLVLRSFPILYFYFVIL